MFTSSRTVFSLFRGIVCYLPFFFSRPFVLFLASSSYTVAGLLLQLVISGRKGFRVAFPISFYFFMA